MIWTSGVDKLCTFVNQRWLDFTGRRLEQELGNGWSAGIHPDDLSQCLDQYTIAFDRRESFHLEYRLRRSDGEYRWILDSGVPRWSADGGFMGYVGSATDVTRHKVAEAALSSMSQRLIDAQEEERAWIARELHDDIGQRFSFLMLNLRRMGDVASLTEIREALHGTIQQALEIYSAMRALSRRLHPPSLDYVGLAAAASGHCSEMAAQYKVTVNFCSENIPRDLSREVSLCLFRILQEALQNAIKHSGAKHFRVSLIAGNAEIELVVRDGGTGFDPEQAFKGRGIGLSSMKERLKVVSGTVSIDSEPGRGTTIHARVPVGEKSGAAFQ
jgi:PAS domain S-box-containing protein